jgi:hypothetical protein
MHGKTSSFRVSNRKTGAVLNSRAVFRVCLDLVSDEYVRYRPRRPTGDGTRRPPLEPRARQVRFLLLHQRLSPWVDERIVNGMAIRPVALLSTEFAWVPRSHPLITRTSNIAPVRSLGALAVSPERARQDRDPPADFSDLAKTVSERSNAWIGSPEYGPAILYTEVLPVPRRKPRTTELQTSA